MLDNEKQMREQIANIHVGTVSPDCLRGHDHGPFRLCRTLGRPPWAATSRRNAVTSARVSNPSNRRGLRTILTAAGRAGVVCLAGLSVAALAACGAGQVSQTANKTSAIQGVNANVGDIAIQNAAVIGSPDISWAKDANVPVSLSLINGGDNPDSLVEAASPDAEEVVVVTGAYDPAEFSMNTASPSVTPTVSVEATTSPSAPATASAAQTPSRSPANPSPSVPNEEPQLTEQDPTVDLAAGELIALTGAKRNGEEPQFLMLKGSHKKLSAGDTVRLVLTFAKAGKVTVRLPVAPPHEPRPRVSLSHKVTEGGH